MAAHKFWRVRATQWVSNFALSNLQMRGVVGGPTLCTGGTVLFSTQLNATTGTTGYAASNVFDALTTTKWANTTNEPTGWIGYEFAAPVEIVELVLASRFDGAPEQAPTSFNLEYSDDGILWAVEPGFAVKGLTTWTLGQTRTFTADLVNWVEDVKVAHRYWRVVSLIDQANVGYAEVAMRAVAGGPNQCTGGTVIFSGQYDAAAHAAINAFDGNTATKWAGATNAKAEWIGYDFGTPKVVTELVLTARPDSPAQSVTSHRLDWSDDGVTWTPEKGFLVRNTYPYAANTPKTFIAGPGSGLEINKTTLQVVSGPSSVGIIINKTTLQVISGPVIEAVGGWQPRTTSFVLLPT